MKKNLTIKWFKTNIQTHWWKKISLQWFIVFAKWLWNVKKIAGKVAKNTSKGEPPTKMLLSHS